MKLKALLLISTLAFVGCKSTDVTQLNTMAKPETIAQAKEELGQYDYLNVTDNGVIVYTERVASGYRWKSANIKEISYRIACENLGWYVESGMIVRMQFKGQGGQTRDYDYTRCLTEVPTDLYESKS
ncbi:hypothetical protein [Vibrio atypicus]|jgi:hypothetical protein|uniref:hypothetical protein n=1 Tax=Vibrio atypicus TaxID=558271 RepID=UPI00135B9DEE|nr:hypothetical protein [Vibrio atypicus]